MKKFLKLLRKYLNGAFVHQDTFSIPTEKNTIALPDVLRFAVEAGLINEGDGFDELITAIKRADYNVRTMTDMTVLFDKK